MPFISISTKAFNRLPRHFKLLTYLHENCAELRPITAHLLGKVSPPRKVSAESLARQAHLLADAAVQVASTLSPDDGRFVSIHWTVADIQALAPGLSKRRARHFLLYHTQRIRERMTEHGHEVLQELLEVDGIKTKQK